MRRKFLEGNIVGYLLVFAVTNLCHYLKACKLPNPLH